jgi:hypothetical protein
MLGLDPSGYTEMVDSMDSVDLTTLPQTPNNEDKNKNKIGINRNNKDKIEIRANIGE